MPIGASYPMIIVAKAACGIVRELSALPFADWLIFASSCSAPRKSARSERTIQRVNTTMTTSNSPTIAIAPYGCWVANQVRKMASPSSPRLKVQLEIGSGEGVTAARTAVLPPWAASAIAPPATVAASCSHGESVAVAR